MSGDAWDAAKEKMDCSNVDVGAFSPVDIMYAIDALKEPGSIEEFHEHMDYGVNEEAMATEEPQPNPECSIGLDELTNFLIANQPQSKQELADRILAKFMVMRRECPSPPTST